MKASHRLVTEYLARFDEASSVIPLSRREALRREVLDHLIDAIPANFSDVDAETILAGFGNPGEIVAQEMEGSPPSGGEPRTTRPLWVLGAVSLVVAAVALAIVTPFLLDDAPSGESAEPGPEGLDVGVVEGGGLLQAGSGKNLAHFTYLCAWEAEYISAEQASDAGRLTSALSTLENFADGAFMSAVSPDGGWKLNVINPLTYANSSGLRHDFPGTCHGAGILNVSNAMRD